MTQDLYTPIDVKQEKTRLFNLQEGIDPILKIPIAASDAVCDHDHVTQRTRAALHRQSNAFEGKVVNAYVRCLSWLTDRPLPELLRNLADYLEADYSKNPHHPGWIRRVSTDFNLLKEKQKDEVLTALGYEKQPNAIARKRLFRKAILSRKFSYVELKTLLERQIERKTIE